jgi:hypothetical protein
MAAFPLEVRGRCLETRCGLACFLPHLRRAGFARPLPRKGVAVSKGEAWIIKSHFAALNSSSALHRACHREYTESRGTRQAQFAPFVAHAFLKPPSLQNYGEPWRNSRWYELQSARHFAKLLFCCD